MEDPAIKQRFTGTGPALVLFWWDERMLLVQLVTGMGQCYEAEEIALLAENIHKEMIRRGQQPASGLWVAEYLAESTKDVTLDGTEYDTEITVTVRPLTESEEQAIREEQDAGAIHAAWEEARPDWLCACGSPLALHKGFDLLCPGEVRSEH